MEAWVRHFLIAICLMAYGSGGSAAFVLPSTSTMPTKTRQRGVNMAMQVSSTKHALLLSRGGALFGAKPNLAPDSFLVGKIAHVLHALFTLSWSSLQHVGESCHVSDLTVIFMLSFASHSVLRLYNDVIHNKILRRGKEPTEYDGSYLDTIGDWLSGFGQIGILVYFGELFLLYLSGLGVPRVSDKPKIVGSFVYGLWFTMKISRFKTYVLNRLLLRYSKRSKLSFRLASRKTLYNRILDSAIYLVALLLFFDANSINAGVAIKSLLTLGGVSSVVVGLALKEPVTEIIQGTSILLSNKFTTGDSILLGDGTSGHVQDIKWTDSQLRGFDGSFVRIPHSQMAKTRVVNLSRHPTSQFREDLNLPYRSPEKIKKLVRDIKDEVKLSCPKLVDNEVLPLNVHWTQFDGKDTMTVTVDCHFYIQRLGTAYWDNRQNVLMAIARAILKNPTS
jgi:small-conductance mechanosensitive channel